LPKPATEKPITINSSDIERDSKTYFFMNSSPPSTILDVGMLYHF
jgi:hypothetical protein